MPKLYKCKKCGVEHSPPTGKHCQQQLQGETAEQSQPANAETTLQQSVDKMLAGMLELTTKVTDMHERLSMVENRDNGDKQPMVPATQPEPFVSASIPGPAAASPDTLRANVELMAQAAARIAQFGTDHDDDDDGSSGRTKSKGKKSGSLLTAADRVEKQIDWPHLHVQRMTGGNRRNLTYPELRTDEFVFGYLAMLKSPKCEMDKDTMIDILSIIMQDSMDYTWPTARGFYQSLGLAVEKAELDWADSDTIRDMRMIYSRTVFQEKHEPKDRKEGAPRQLRAAPPGMKCCPAFQKKACEQTKDHPPFTHACSYCHRVCSALCRHGEEECMRKMSDDSKNGRKREV